MQQQAFPHRIELFVIQRCWFSGPNVEPSVDCRRLFTSRREAEEVAYHCAHAYANQNNNNNPSRSVPNASVKTILLPPSASGPTSSYAFQTCGKLFWVRSLKASVVPHIGVAQAAGLTYPLNVHTNNTHAAGDESPLFATAEVVLTHNIIGGTGNRNSRRGSEATEGQVFVSTDPANANRCAVEAARQFHDALTQQHGGNPNIHIQVVSCPVGKSNSSNNTHTLPQDWPAVAPIMHQQHDDDHLSHDQWSADPRMTYVPDPSTKREWAPFNDATTTTMAADPLDCGGMDPRANPDLPSKRQCRFTSTTTNPAVVSTGGSFGATNGNCSSMGTMMFD